MKLLATRENFNNLITEIALGRKIGFDTETYGLGFDDKLFAMIFAVKDRVYYFNFHEYPGMNPQHILPREWIKEGFNKIFGAPHLTLYISNAKFDMGMMAKEGVEIKARVVCTHAMGRVLKNNHMAYSLEESAKRIGLVKRTDLIEKSITSNKYFEYITIPGKKKRVQNRQYWKVDFDTMFEYATEDAILHLKLGTYLDEELDKLPDLHFVRENEVALTKVCHKMEMTGIQLRKEYTEDALAHENALLEQAKREFQDMAGRPYMESNKAFGEIFRNLGVEYAVRETGNGIFDEGALEKIKHPIAEQILKIRHLDKRIGTYYSSFLYYADKSGVIHPSMNQAGTETGRFSYSNPNLQNVPKEDEKGKKFYVRGCFGPRDGHILVSIDYSQQEYRLMLDYAGEHDLIEQINNGADVHQAMADMVGINRQQAKTLNFACLYGAGQQKIAEMLGMSIPEAGHLLGLYYSRLPKVAHFQKQVISKGRNRGFIFNWAGRRCHIANPEWAYILPNHLIQGGGADIMKVALVRLYEFLKHTKSRMLITVHDEVLLEMHPPDLDLIPKIQNIMETVYKSKNGILMKTEVAHSRLSWGYGDLIKGAPA